jgi:hypothetical protein
MSDSLIAAPTVELYEISTVIKSTYAHFIIYGACFLGLSWALFNIWIVSCSTSESAVNSFSVQPFHNSYSNFFRL